MKLGTSVPGSAVCSKSPIPTKKALSRATAPIAHADAEADEISPFREAIEFHRQKIDIPTQAWTDIMHEAHDRAFVVAGAMKEALLEDIHQAMIEGLRGKLSFEAWLERFDDIVARHGWSYRGGREWRARVIYETNLRTARAAGRFKQMRHPDTLAAFPYWRYVHASTRVPSEPREEHESWDGLILPATDPWWETYYPPNGWRCSCGVEAITAAEMRRTKGQPDIAPEIRYRKRTDPHTGEMVDYPDGVDFGWAYAPGRTWALGLAPAPVDPPLKRHVWNVAGLLRKPEDLPPLQELAKAPPAQARDLARDADGKLNRQLLDDIRALVRAHDRWLKEHPGRPITEWERWGEWDAANRMYVGEFYWMLHQQRPDVDADINRDVLFTDAAGTPIVISADLFRDAGGDWKALKRERWRYIHFMAAALLDPDEIWLSSTRLL